MTNRKRSSKKWLVALIVVAAISGAPGAAMRWKIGQSVKEKAPEMISPARLYSVSVKGGAFDIIKGRIEAINIRGYDVRLANGLTIDRLDVRLKEIRFKPDQTITDVQSADFSAILTESNLIDFMSVSRPDMKDAKVVLDDGILKLSVSPRVLATRTPVTLECSLQIEEDTRLNLVINRLVARGIRVPGFVKEKLTKDLNPVFDTSQMDFDAKLKSVDVSNGAITLKGNADVRQALAR